MTCDLNFHFSCNILCNGWLLAAETEDIMVLLINDTYSTVPFAIVFLVNILFAAAAFNFVISFHYESFYPNQFDFLFWLQCFVTVDWVS